MNTLWKSLINLLSVSLSYSAGISQKQFIAVIQTILYLQVCKPLCGKIVWISEIILCLSTILSQLQMRLHMKCNGLDVRLVKCVNTYVELGFNFIFGHISIYFHAIGGKLHILKTEVHSSRHFHHQTHYRSYQVRLLRIRWPNQQCQALKDNDEEEIESLILLLL